MTTSEQERLHVFYDGFNLYYALRRKGWHRYLWLDYSALARDLVRDGQVLTGATYVTARVPGPDASARRQALYLGRELASAEPRKVVLITPPATKAEELAAACTWSVPASPGGRDEICVSGHEDSRVVGVVCGAHDKREGEEDVAALLL